MTFDNCELKELTASVLPLNFSTSLSMLHLFKPLIFKVRGITPEVRHTSTGLILVQVYSHSFNSYSNYYKLTSVQNKYGWKCNFVPSNKTKTSFICLHLVLTRNTPSLCWFPLPSMHASPEIQTIYASDRKNKLSQLLRAVFPWRRHFDAICQKPKECFNGQFTSNDCSCCQIKEQRQKI